MICIVIVAILVICTNAAPISPTMENSDLVMNSIDGSDLATVGEEGDYFEGDMLLTAAQKRAVSMAMRERNGLRGGAQRWPNRTVVYHIEDDNFDETQVELIMKGMADISNKSCIRFRQRNEEDDLYVTIKGSGIGCFSSVGFQNPDSENDGKQVINLSKGCFKHGTVVHEMLHTIGFYHMQSTYDRDDFVKIIWENIKEGVEHNFAKYNNDTITDFGVPYDYGSVMHYPETAFSKNGNKTIITLQENVIIGQRNGMSESDILKLNKMYCVPSDDEEIQLGI